MIAFLPDQTRLSQVRLRTATLETALAFYSATLGMHAVREAGGKATLFAASGRPLIILTEDQDAAPRPARASGLYHFALSYPRRKDLARAYQSLLSHGRQIAGGSDHGVSEAVYLKDPDGNGVELSVDRPRTQWRTENGQIVMRTGALDLGNLLATVAGGSNPGEQPAPPAGIGHVHFRVADLEAAERFYSHFLGLVVTHRSCHGAMFFAAGSYHHHIGVSVWAAPAVAPDRCAGLISYRVEVPESEVLYCLAHRAPLLGYETRSGPAEPGGPILQIRDPNGAWLEVQPGPNAQAVGRERRPSTEAGPTLISGGVHAKV